MPSSVLKDTNSVRGPIESLLKQSITKIAIDLEKEPVQHLPENWQERARFFEFVLENMRQGFWRLDPDGRIAELNPYLSSWLEGDEKELLGKSSDAFITKRLPAAEPDGALSSRRFEAEFITVTGVQRHAIVVSMAIPLPGTSKMGKIELITDVTAEHAMQARLVREVQQMAKLAGQDSLTGLPNRRTFDGILHEAKENQSERPFALVMIDLNNFKELNDNYGHEAGDVLLIRFASQLRSVIRETDFAARIGGDEFAVILFDVDLEESTVLAQRLEQNLACESEIDGELVTLGASIGYAHSSQHVEKILQKADRAMYERKKRNRRVASS